MRTKIIYFLFLTIIHFGFIGKSNLQLKNSSHGHEKKVRAQGMEHMIINLAIMLGAQFAVEGANEWTVSQYSVLYDVLTRTSTTIQNDFSIFQNKVNTFVSEVLTDVINNFVTAQTTISDQTAQAQIDAGLESNYLMEMVDLDLAQSEYLFSPGIYDAAFFKSKMYTPAGQSWYNIFAKGDWGFDAATSSFWQYNLINAYQLDSDTNTNTLDQAGFNYIFTEFFTKKDSYTIDCDITLYMVSYPFFSGIIFNNNRWISGDMSGLKKYRTVGIYGKSKDEIGVYYAEQYTDTTIVQTTTDITQMVSPIQYPLDQIFNGTAQKIGEIKAADFDTLSEQEVSYSFKINTSANNILVSFNQAGSTEVTSASVISKDATLFLYHGAGFVSPGAVAKYTLNGPESILFTNNAITDFKIEVDALTQAAAA